MKIYKSGRGDGREFADGFGNGGGDGMAYEGGDGREFGFSDGKGNGFGDGRGFDMVCKHRDRFDQARYGRDTYPIRQISK